MGSVALPCSGFASPVAAGQVAAVTLGQALAALGVCMPAALQGPQAPQAPPASIPCASPSPSSSFSSSGKADGAAEAQAAMRAAVEAALSRACDPVSGGNGSRRSPLGPSGGGEGLTAAVETARWSVEACLADAASAGHHRTLSFAASPAAAALALPSRASAVSHLLPFPSANAVTRDAAALEAMEANLTAQLAKELAVAMRSREGAPVGKPLQHAARAGRRPGERGPAAATGAGKGPVPASV